MYVHVYLSLSIYIYICIYVYIHIWGFDLSNPLIVKSRTRSSDTVMTVNHAQLHDVMSLPLTVNL